MITSYIPRQKGGFLQMMIIKTLFCILLCCPLAYVAFILCRDLYKQAVKKR